MCQDLGDSLNGGPIIKLKEENDGAHEIVYIEKQLLSRFGAFSAHIYADKHPPPHFHVKYNGEENSFSIETGEPLHPNNGLSRYFKNINKWYKKNNLRLIDCWNENRPDNCPAGQIKC